MLSGVLGNETDKLSFKQESNKASSKKGKYMHNQTLITVRDVQASTDWYTKNLGLAKGHGGAHYEQLIYKGKLILQLHNMDPDENHGALLDIGELPGKGVLIWLRVEHFDELVERLGEIKSLSIKDHFSTNGQSSGKFGLKIQMDIGLSYLVHPNIPSSH